MHSKLENKILYWNGILDPDNLASCYADIIQKMIAGDYESLHLKKLAGHNVYSVRINKSDRLLFTTIVVKGLPYLILLDEVLNHDYAKSRFLKPSVLKNYLELHGTAISEELTSSHFQAHTQSDIPSSEKDTAKKSITFSQIDFYNQKFIELDTTQLAVIGGVLPMIISGAAGSGKSCLALSIFSQYISTNTENEYPILYVTESEKLAITMQSSWLALPIAQNMDANAVQFKCYQQLIRDLHPDNENLVFVSKDHCINWLASYIKQYRKISLTIKNATLNDSFFEDIDLIYQEFRIISACANREAYKMLGQKQAFFSDKQEQEQKWIFTTYALYQEHLAQSKCVHVPFYSVTVKNKFKLIVVDESQDFSQQQLESLANLACNKQICFCEDNRQSLSDNKSKIPFLKSLMYSWGKKENIKNMETSWRCPEAIINIANKISELKSIVTKDGQPKTMMPLQSNNKGTVKLFLEKKELLALRDEASSHEFAIITLDKYKEEAQELFDTALVFNIGQIKGFQYRTILFYCLLDDILFQEPDTLIGRQSPEISIKSGNRAKRNQGNEQFGLLFNRIYTGVTRCMDTLYIYQPKRHYLTNIMNRLSNVISAQKSVNSTDSPPLSTTSLNDWYDEAKKHMQADNIDIAKKIYCNNLNKSASEFEEFKKLFSNPVLPSVPEITHAIKPVSNSCHEANKTSKPDVITKQQTQKKATTMANKIPIEKSQCRTETTKIPDQITRLLKNVTNNTLFSFLKQKNAVDLLYNKPMADGACLFTHLFYKLNTRTALYYCLASLPNKIRISLSKGLTEKALCHAYSISLKETPSYSPLYWLTLDDPGLKTLRTMFTDNNDIGKLINSAALCMALPSSAGPYENLSPLHLFSINEKRIVLLINLFISSTSLTESSQLDETSFILMAQKSPLATSIPLEALCRHLTTKAARNADISPLFMFSHGIEGVAVLNILLLNKTNLANSIFADALCRTCNLAIDYDANTSAFYWLSTTFEGINLLKNMLTQNPELAKLIRLKTLCLPLSLKTKKDANKSALYWLASFDNGLEVLDILTSTANLDEPIELETLGNALCLALPSAAEEHAALTPLYLLLTTPQKQKRLHTLFTNKPNLTKYITPEALCLARPAEAENQANVSPLFLLSISQIGRDILYTILTHNPALVKSITMEDLMRMPTMATDEYANTSPLYWLLMVPDGQIVLNLLAPKNPELEKIIMEAAKFEPSPLASLGLFSKEELQNISNEPEDRHEVSSEYINQTRNS